MGCTRDVLIDRVEAEKCELSAGATISFALNCKDGRPRAEDIKVLIKGFPMKERTSKLIGLDIDWNKNYTGIIRTLWQGGKDSIFNVPSMQKNDPGGAFIVSEDAHEVFKLDVWAYPAKLAGFKVGDVVKFRVEIDSWWSYPCAHDVKAADPALQDVIRAKHSSLQLQNGFNVFTLAAKSPAAITAAVLPENMLRLDASAEEVSAYYNSLRAPQSPSLGEPTELQSGRDEATEAVKKIGEDREDVREGVEGLVASVPTPSRSSSRSSNARIQCSAQPLEVDDRIRCPEVAEPSAKTEASTWRKYKVDSGDGLWWWCAEDDDWFLEDDPGPWTKYIDPDTDRHYWWKNEDQWFWA